MLRQMHAVRKAARKPSPIPDPIAALLAERDRQWHERIEQYAAALAKTWDEFEIMVATVDEDLGGEVNEDEWGDLSAAFSRLRRLGVRFDPTFIEKFDRLNPVPDAFDPKDQIRAVRDCNARARTSESFVEDDDYEHGGDGSLDDLASDELGPSDED